MPEGPDAGPLFAGVEELFGETYKSIYTLRLDEPAEVVNWKLEAIGPAAGFGDGYQLGDGGWVTVTADPAVEGAFRAWTKAIGKPELRDDPRFAAARTFVELGPRASLIGSAAMVLDAEEPALVAAIARRLA